MRKLTNKFATQSPSWEIHSRTIFVTNSLSFMAHKYCSTLFSTGPSLTAMFQYPVHNSPSLTAMFQYPVHNSPSLTAMFQYPVHNSPSLTAMFQYPLHNSPSLKNEDVHFVKYNKLLSEPTHRYLLQPAFWRLQLKSAYNQIIILMLSCLMVDPCIMALISQNTINRTTNIVILIG